MKRARKQKQVPSRGSKANAEKNMKEEDSKAESRKLATVDKILIGLVVVLLLAVIIVGYQVWKHLNLISKTEESIKIIENVKSWLKDSQHQAQSVQLFDRLGSLINNRLYHDSIVRAITNASFIKFVATHMTEQAATCTAPHSHDIVIKTLNFILDYAKWEKQPVCLVPEPVQVLFRCSMFSDIKPAIWHFVESTIEMTGNSCEQEYLRAFINLAMMSRKTKLYTEALEFSKDRSDETLIDNKLRVCNLVDAARKNIKEWDETTKTSICALSKRLTCNVFQTLDVDSWC